MDQLDTFLKEEHESWHASLEAGFAKVRDGVTTIPEVLRVTKA